MKIQIEKKILKRLLKKKLKNYKITIPKWKIKNCMVQSSFLFKKMKQISEDIISLVTEKQIKLFLTFLKETLNLNFTLVLNGSLIKGDDCAKIGPMIFLVIGEKETLKELQFFNRKIETEIDCFCDSCSQELIEKHLQKKEGDKEEQTFTSTEETNVKLENSPKLLIEETLATPIESNSNKEAFEKEKIIVFPTLETTQKSEDNEIHGLTLPDVYEEKTEDSNLEEEEEKKIEKEIGFNIEGDARSFHSQLTEMVNLNEISENEMNSECANYCAKRMLNIMIFAEKHHRAMMSILRKMYMKFEQGHLLFQKGIKKENPLLNCSFCVVHSCLEERLSIVGEPGRPIKYSEEPLTKNNFSL